MGSDFGAIKTAATRIGISIDEYLSFVRDGLKFCYRCRLWKDRALFCGDSSRGDGRASKCRNWRLPSRQLRLRLFTAADCARRRYAEDETYRETCRQKVHARARGVDPMPLAGIEAMREKFGTSCAYCTAQATTWDHIVPVSQGGRTISGNIVPACRSCNSRKRTMSVYDFIDKHNIVVSSALESELALALETGDL